MMYGKVALALVLVGAWLRGSSKSSSSSSSEESDPSNEYVPDNPRAGATPDRMVPLSEHYVLADALVSNAHPELAAQLKPTPDQVKNLQALFQGPVEGIASQLNERPVVTSGFRSAELNKAISGSSATSQHMAGGDSAAADLFPPDLMDAATLADALVASKAPFDQAIIYSRKRGGQLHVSHRRTGKNRYQLMIAPDGGGYETISTPDEAIEKLGDSLV